VDQLSGGQRQRISIALALVNRPKVVFLDEPTTGLDPAARRDLWQTIEGIRRAGTTVVLTTHYMEEAEVLCDRVAVMDRGQVIACDTPAALIRNLGKTATVRARVLRGELPASALAELPAVTESHLTEPGPGLPPELALHTTDAQATLVGLLTLASRDGVTLGDLRSDQASLEDVFLSLTGRQYEPGAETEEAGDGRREAGGGRKRRRGG
jgi:ABC-2 type transport system ATP-binding protein